MASRKISTAKGFTLIELLVVMGLLAFVGGFTLIVSMDSFRGHSFRSERDILLAVLQKARSQSINNMCFGAGCTNGKPHGIHIENNRYTIFQGASYALRDTALDEVIEPRSKSLVLSGVTDIIFTELSGSAAMSPVGQSGILMRDSAGKDSSLVVVNTEGRICFDEATC